MTPNKEDYLKIIFELGGTEHKVTNKQIMNSLQISAPSVSEMMTKLLKDDYIVHVPYKGVQLTEKGENKASILVRKHRLWEVFLVKKLEFPWNEVHEEAEVLEHVTSRELANKLDKFLDYPKTCPHGGVIPSDHGQFPEKNNLSLVHFGKLKEIRIKRVLDDKELLDYLSSLEIKVGQVYTVKEYGIYEGPITLEHDRKEKQISYKAASNIFVEEI
ncbi:metal-dependent transcriptional regulator [Desemzia sp. RIT804]|uniref:metal-dependent transcriptional regulator n=1 Tax=Desemzia sp. RIT 804 TaxID=2810209 RepID=UPI00194F2CFE|nr:metal-dependent transcriptional regulator [Desemzia sp. RIT 804]MBM6613405.1 metal-dependent transcriptional regulator [Desemzia sp. RIT 804]